MDKSYKPRLEILYRDKIIPQLQKDLQLKNIMEVPKVNKVVLNIGVKEAVSDSKALKVVEDVLAMIAGQKVVRTVAKKSIAGFKIRKGMPLGAMVTLRNERMYEFLDRLIHFSLPMVRDFHGVSTKLDRQGNYNLGIKEWVVFPEVDYETANKIYGLNISIHTSTKDDAQAFELLKSFGMPFKKSK